MTSQDVILGLLMKRTASGYEIKNMFQRWLSYFFDASYGTIYPTLAKMEAEGLITKQSVPQEKKPTKHVYAITALGRDRFQASLASDLQDNVVRSDLMTRLFFGEFAEEAIVLGWLEQSRAKLETRLKQLEDDYAFVRGHQPSRTQLICIEMGLDNVRAMLKSVTDSIARLQEETADE